MCKAPNWTISGLTISMCFKTIQLTCGREQFSAVRCGICKLDIFNNCKLASPATFPCECIYVAKGYGQQNLMDFPNGEEGGVVSLSVVGHLTSHKVMEASTWLSPQIWENWFHSREF